MNITVVSTSSPNYLQYKDGIESDCKKFSYNFYYEKNEKSFKEAGHAWAYKPYFIKKCLEQFEKIIYVDLEVRFHKALPQEWLNSPLVLPKFSPVFPTNILLFNHSGFMIMDRTAIPLVDLWIKLIERWKLATATLDEVDTRHKGGLWALTEETVLNISLAALGIYPKEISVSWQPKPKLGTEEMRLGGQFNEHTIIQHPFLQHWSQLQFQWSEYEFYRMFRYHFMGDFKSIEQKMMIGKECFTELGWYFDCTNKTYAPEDFLSIKKANWMQAKHNEWEKTWWC